MTPAFFLVPLTAALFAASPAEPAASDFANSLAEGIEIIVTEYDRPFTRARLAAWAVEGLYEEFKTPVPAELRGKLARLGDLKEDQVQQVLREAAAPFGPRLKDDIGRERAVGACINAVFLKLEPAAQPKDRSCFISTRERDSGCDFGFRLTGIGVKLRADPASGMLRIDTPIHKGPAYRAGLRAGDLVTHIIVKTDASGEPLAKPEEHSTKGMSVEQAYKLILGKKETSLTQRVIPAR